MMYPQHIGARPRAYACAQLALTSLSILRSSASFANPAIPPPPPPTASQAHDPCHDTEAYIMPSTHLQTVCPCWVILLAAIPWVQAINLAPTQLSALSPPFQRFPEVSLDYAETPKPACMQECCVPKCCFFIACESTLLQPQANQLWQRANYRAWPAQNHFGSLNISHPASRGWPSCTSGDRHGSQVCNA
jgi:hypothetical protein